MRTGWSTLNEPFKLLVREHSPHEFEMWIRLVGLILGNGFASDIREDRLCPIGGVGGTCVTNGFFLCILSGASLKLKEFFESLFVSRTAR